MLSVRADSYVNVFIHNRILDRAHIRINGLLLYLPQRCLQGSQSEPLR